MIACVAWAAGGTKSLVMQGWGRLQLRRSLCTTPAWRTGGQLVYGIFLWLEAMLYDRLATAQNVVNPAREQGCGGGGSFGGASAVARNAGRVWLGMLDECGSECWTKASFCSAELHPCMQGCRWWWRRRRVPAKQPSRRRPQSRCWRAASASSTPRP